MDQFQQIFFSTFGIAFGLLHTILYVYNRHLRSNLYFAVFASVYAASVFLDFQASLSTNQTDLVLCLRAHRLFFPAS